MPFEHGAGGDVDDLAVALAAHDRQHGLDAFERAADVDPHDGVEFLGVELLEGAGLDRREDRRIVDEAVDASEPLFPSARPG